MLYCSVAIVKKTTYNTTSTEFTRQMTLKGDWDDPSRHNYQLYKLIVIATSSTCVLYVGKNVNIDESCI